MGWIIGLTVTAVFLLAVLLWKIYNLKREAEHFSQQVGRALEDIIAGRGFEASEAMTDTLWGKTSEKLERLNRLWQSGEKASLLEKEKMKGLISDISHQTKHPIANIKLYIEFLQEENLSEKGQGFLEELDIQAEKLDFLLQSMVKMSRLETGIIRVQGEYANLYETLGRVVADVVPAATAKKLSLSVDCEENLCVYHDRKWMREALFNVLDNAVKYTEPGGSIHVAICQQEIFTKIIIRDTGKGIRQERQAEIFTRFYREPEVHDKPGVGIGLYLTREILEEQGGYIEVVSEEGEGAQFNLYLPNVF